MEKWDPGNQVNDKQNGQLSVAPLKMRNLENVCDVSRKYFKLVKSWAWYDGPHL